MRDFGSDIWVADGPPVRALGPVTLPTRMIVARLSDGSLWINSPVEGSTTVMESIASHGPVKHLVAPTPLHVWRLASWKAFFPQAMLWGPPMRRAGRGRIAFDGILGDTPPAEWSADIDQAVFRGNVLLDEVEFFHKRSRTLIFTDFIQNYPALPHRPIRNSVLHFAGVLGGGVPRDIRMSFTSKSLARQSLSSILSWDFDKLVVAHGDCIERDAKPFVERALSWLL
jgi:hypothetical protein